MPHLASNHIVRVLAAADHSAGADQSRITASWRRCLINHKLDPARHGPPQTLTESEVKRITEPLEELLPIVVREIEDLARVVRDAGYCVNFADTNANVLVSRLPGGDYASMYRKLNVYTGSNFAEALEGTNGIGTAIAEQKPILVHRDEHFREQWSLLTCAVSPLFDHRGRLTGAVNISSCRDDLDRAAHQLAFSIATEATLRIEYSIFRQHFRNCWIATLPGEEGNGMVAYDDDRRVVGACRRGRPILGLTDSMIESGVELSRFVQMDDRVTRISDSSFELRRVDGSPLGRVQIVPPAGARPKVQQFKRLGISEDRFAGLHKLAGSDPVLMQRVKQLVTVGDLDLPILIHGETGAGKDVFARAIHTASDRARNNYVALNCAAMPESLIDSELFGYEAGAFTGARREGSKGLIVQANGGTLFLDEIGDMPLALQARLLRVLENREVWPLGSRRPVAVDIRLISATHRDLGRMTEEGTFRSDLYYRLRGMEVRLPALRERQDKAEVIAQIAQEEARHCRISPTAWTMLLSYPFPGNMRQVRHVLRLAGCIAEDGVITEATLDLPSPCGHTAESDHAAAERAKIMGALRIHGGRVTDAARALNLSRATLYRKIKLLKISLDIH